MNWTKFQAIVFNGTLSAQGMPAFSKTNYPDAAAQNDFSHLWFSKNCPVLGHNVGTVCQDCHAANGDPNAIAKGGIFTLAGTLYDNNTASQTGLAGDRIRVFLNNTNTLMLSLITDKNGNFYTTQPLDFATASAPEVKSTHRSMASKPNDGKCNSCHQTSQSGRITP